MIVLAVARAHHLIIPAGNPLWLAGYAAAVITVATAVRYLIEKPAMSWMRRRFLSPATVLAVDPLPASGHQTHAPESVPAAANQ